jgi:hypothetical protein
MTREQAIDRLVNQVARWGEGERDTSRPADWDSRPNRRAELCACPDCGESHVDNCDDCGCCGFCGDCHCGGTTRWDAVAVE